MPERPLSLSTLDSFPTTLSTLSTLSLLLSGALRVPSLLVLRH